MVSSKQSYLQTSCFLLTLTLAWDSTATFQNSDLFIMSQGQSRTCQIYNIDQDEIVCCTMLYRVYTSNCRVYSGVSTHHVTYYDWCVCMACCTDYRRTDLCMHNPSGCWNIGPSHLPVHFFFQFAQSSHVVSRCNYHVVSRDAHLKPWKQNWRDLNVIERTFNTRCDVVSVKACNPL